MSSAGAPALATAPAGPTRRGWFVAAAVTLSAVAFVACLTSVYNFDIFWHLASGEWMLDHGRVLAEDPFGIDPPSRWVNVHWLFQVIVAGVHALGGFAALSVLKATLAAATMLVWASALRRDGATAWLVLCGLLTLAGIEMRFRVRPEAFTLLLLTVTVMLVESVRRGGRPRRLWLLAPMMVVWVNLHGLYVLGPAVFWSAAVGDLIDRRLRRPGSGALSGRRVLWPLAVATAACFVSPWPLAAAAQPLLLWTRVSGQTAAFTQGVSEFLPTWQSPYHLVLGVALIAPAAVACAIGVRRVPIAHGLWLVAFGVLAALARRNVALAACVCGYLLALHGGGAIRRIVGAAAGRKRLAVGVNIATLALAIAAAGLWATEWPFRVRQLRRRFGPGLYRPNYPIDVARRLGELPAPGDVFCTNWGDAGAFIYHSRPRRVWMDGRLEAHSFDRLVSQERIQRALRTVRGAGAVKLPEMLRFFFVRWSSPEHLTALSASPRFRLLLLDSVGACFARTDFPAGAAALPARSNLHEFDRPMGGDGRIAPVPCERYRWWRQNPPPTCYALGTMFLHLAWQRPGRELASGDLDRPRCALLAARYLTAARRAGLVDRDAATGMAAQAHQQLALWEDVTPSKAVPFDLHSARALRLYGRIDLANLADENIRRFAIQHVDARIRARQLDLAETAATALLAGFPANADPDVRKRCERTLAVIRTALAQSRERAKRLPDWPFDRARALAGADVGLMRDALREADSKKLPTTQYLLHGDLLLRCGETAQANRCYAFLLIGEKLLTTPGESSMESFLPPRKPGRINHGVYRRLAVSMAVDGKYEAAERFFGDLHRVKADPQAAYYHGLVLEVLGEYARARNALAGAEPTDPQLRRLIDRLRRRLALR